MSQKNLEKIWKETNGASLIFVLGIMLVLLFFCSGVLVLTKTSLNYSVKNAEKEQGEIYGESIHKTILHSLNQKEEPMQSLMDIKHLSGAVAKSLYENVTESSVKEQDIVIPIKMEMDFMADYKVELIELQMTVEVEAETVCTIRTKGPVYLEVLLKSEKNYSVTARAEYEFEGVIIQEIEDVPYLLNQGTWRMVGYETVS